MSEAPEPRKALPVSKWAGVTTNEFLWPWLIVPSLCVFLKGTGVVLLSLKSSGALMQYVSWFWPIAQDHYNEIARLGSEGEAANFALFCAVAVPFVFASTWWAMTKYPAVRNNLRIEPSDYFMLLMAPGIVLYVLFFDAVKSNPTAYWDFFVDSYGLYYFRQAIGPLAVVTSFVFLLALAAEAFRRSRL